MTWVRYTTEYKKKFPNNENQSVQTCLTLSRWHNSQWALRVITIPPMPRHSYTPVNIGARKDAHESHNQ